MDRREFVKTLAAGGLLVGAGAILGSGCAEQAEDEPQIAPDAGPPPDEAGAPADDGAASPTDDAAAVDDGDAEQATVICPNCGAENEVDEWGVELTCWRCGHKWAPQRPA